VGALAQALTGKETQRHTNLLCFLALHCVKCGRDSFALAEMMVISPSSPMMVMMMMVVMVMMVMMMMMMMMMMISVREARILLCVGCDSP